MQFRVAMGLDRILKYKTHLIRSAVFLALLFFLPSACATLNTLTLESSRGVYHTVGPDEDIWRISRAYEVDAKTIMESNEIYNPDDIKEGDKIFIPGARKVLEVPPPTYEELAEAAKKGLFVWPVDGMIYSLFGPRCGRIHKGIDISAPIGIPVSASRDGDVVFAGRRGGYGNVVEIKHDDHYMTVYAHLSKVFVKEGDSVKRGDVIGNVGSTGRTTGPHLHFEIRYDDIPRNPLYFLP